MACARKGEDYLLTFPGLAGFRILFEQRRIEAFAGPGCPDATLAHLLLDQVVPRALCHQGRMVIHASAVQMADGRAVAFTGPSGRGKSTLAAAFLNHGCALLSDDCLLVEEKAGGVSAVPAYSSLRLWADSAEALNMLGNHPGARVSAMAHYSEKKQLLLSEPEAAATARRADLCALFLLQEPAAGSAAGLAVRITPAGGMASILAVIEAQFALDVVRSHIVQRSFELVGQVFSAVPVFRLAYPRDMGKMPEVIDAVRRAIAPGDNDISMQSGG